MARIAIPICALLLAVPGQAQERPAVEASAPTRLAVTVYRDPNRSEEGRMERDWPQGFAMISETRQVTLLAGRSTIRFTGVAEGMVAVSAIVTGLPGGTIEKNRDAALLSPAALVDGTLGNRITVTRTNPATGRAASERAIVRTRADGGLVLETAAGFETVRCSGLAERLSFDRVPAGLSPHPVFTLDTQSAAGGTYTVTLTYLAWGFDWDASYVGTLREGAGRDGRVSLVLMSWLTILNDNGQSFADAELMAVAGKLNVESDFEDLAEEPDAEPLRLVCYPLGSTAAGSPFAPPPPPPPPPPPMMAAPMPVASIGEEVIVTGSRVNRAVLKVVANEEGLGDLKLYRVPERVTVAAKAQKQVAFLDREGVTGRFVYVQDCDANDEEDESDLEPARILLATENTAARGLGAALPQGRLTLYEPTGDGAQLVAETTLRDFAKGEEVELELAASAQVQAVCGAEATDGDEKEGAWRTLVGIVHNANPAPVTVRFRLGWASQWAVRGARGVRVKDGWRIVEVTVPGNTRRRFGWQVHDATE